jgi:hypothetical protein
MTVGTIFNIAYLPMLEPKKFALWAVSINATPAARRFSPILVIELFR